MKAWLQALVVGAGVLALASTASAAFTSTPVNCDGGGDVLFNDIFESNAGAGPLFNADNPDCLGNVIDFDPSGFVVESNGAGLASIDGQLNFTINSKDVVNSFIDSVMLSESGDYTLLGSDPQSFADARMNLRVEIQALAGNPNFVQDGPFLEFVTLSIPVDVNILGSWSLSHTVDIVQVLIDAGFSQDQARATEVDVILDNTLTVYAANGDVSRIIKKDTNGLTITAMTPEPGAGLLIGAALLSLAALRRRS